MGYTVRMVRNVLLAGNTSCIHAIRMPHTPTIVRTAGAQRDADDQMLWATPLAAIW